MSIQAPDVIEVHTGAGAALNGAIPGQFHSEAQVRVYKLSNVDGVTEQLLVAGTDYTITKAAVAGSSPAVYTGSITTVASISATEKVAVMVWPANEQLVDFSAVPYDPMLHERELDLAAMRDAALFELIKRSPRMGLDYTGGQPLISDPSQGKALIWGEGAKIINGPSTDEIANAQAYAQTASDSAVSAANSLDEMTDLYLGKKTSDPSTDNDGDSLVGGALYFNTTDQEMRVYDGDRWVSSWTISHAVTLEQFGALADGSDDATAWEAAMDYLEARGGGTLSLRPGRTYRTTAITHASNVRVEMNGATLAVHSSMAKTGNWYVNRDIGTAKRCQIIGPGTLDGSARLFDRWLSQLDGTAVTDPEADYVMGTGALASGISGVDLTAVLTGDAVSSVTINNGGVGWNGHPTEPYQPSTVALMFTGGGGEGASGYATISGGTLTSVTITNGGKNYTSAPTVTTMGGYADIRLLTDPSVDRRNPNYVSAGSGVYFGRVFMPVIENVTFVGFRCRSLTDAGCDQGHYKNNEFKNCGKDDGPFHCFWVQSYGTPGAGQPWYQPTRGILVENMRAVEGIERSAIQFAPTGGGTLRGLVAKGGGESTIFINEKLNHDGGHALIEGCDLSDNYLTDIAAQLIEHGGVKNLTVRDTRLSGSSLQAAVATGCTNVLYKNCTFENNRTALTSTNDKRTPYGPFSERYDFNVGERPVCGAPVSIEGGSVVSIGSIGSNGGNGVRFKDCHFSEDRSVYPEFIFGQTKSGSNNIAGDTTIEDNNMVAVPAGMGLLRTSIASVWQAIMPLHIRRNLGHASEAPVIINHQVSSTGTFNIQPGFRPSRVDVYADVNNGSRLRASHGAFSWTRDGVRNDFVHTFAAAEDAAAERGAIIAAEVVRILDPANNNTQVSVEFGGWLELGFWLNCVTYAELTNIRFVCHP